VLRIVGVSLSTDYFQKTYEPRPRVYRGARAHSTKTPNMNAHIESFHRMFEDDSLSRMEFENYAQAYECVDTFMKWYNPTRIH